MAHKAVARIVCFGLVGLALAWPSAGGGEELKHQGRDTFHCTDMEFVAVGDAPGHELSVFTCEGFEFTEGGETGTLVVTGTGEYRGNQGTEIGYAVATFADGSTSVSEWRQQVSEDAGGETVSIEGAYRIVGGSGRWAGITGTGTYTGKRHGNKGYIDWSATFTLPAQ